MEKVEPLDPVQSMFYRPRLPRIGKIRLGEKAESRGGKEHPKALEFFNFRDVPQVAEVYGDKCKTLFPVQFPSGDSQVFFPTRRAAYRKSGLFCTSRDDKLAVRVFVDEKRVIQQTGEEVWVDEQGVDELRKDPDLWDAKADKPIIKGGEMFEMDCPGEECSFWRRGFCKRNARLFFVLPRVSEAGCFEIATTSINGIQNILDTINFIRLKGVNPAWLPFHLHLVPDRGKDNATIYVLKLEFRGQLPTRQAIGALPAATIQAEDPTPDDLAPRGGAALDDALAGVTSRVEVDGDLIDHAINVGVQLGLTRAQATLRAKRSGTDLPKLIEEWEGKVFEAQAAKQTPAPAPTVVVEAPGQPANDPRDIFSEDPPDEPSANEEKREALREAATKGLESAKEREMRPAPRQSAPPKAQTKSLLDI